MPEERSPSQDMQDPYADPPLQPDYPVEPEPPPVDRDEPTPEPNAPAPPSPEKKVERAFTVKNDWVEKEWGWKEQAGSNPDPALVDKSKPSVYQAKHEWIDASGKVSRGDPPPGAVLNEYYAPGTAMWNLGYKSLADYYESGAAVSEEHPANFAPYVNVDTPDGQRHITRQESNNLSKITNQAEQTKALIKMVELDNKYVVLGDSSLMTKDDFNSLLPQEREDVLQRGYKAIGDIQARQKSDIKAIAPYKVPGSTNDYYISDAIKGGVDERVLIRTFGLSAVNNARDKMDESSKAKVEAEVTDELVTRSGEHVDLAKIALAQEKSRKDIPFSTERVTRQIDYRVPKDTLTEELEKSGIDPRIAGILAGVQVGASATPIPHDDLIWLAAALAVVGTAKAVQLIRQWKDSQGSIAVVDAKGNVAVYNSRGAQRSAGESVIPLEPPTVTPKGTQIIPPAVAKSGTSMNPPRIISHGTTMVPPRTVTAITFLPGPTMQQRDAADSIITAQAAATMAASKVKSAVSTLPIDYNKILDDINKARTAEDTQKAFDTINSAIETYRPKVKPDEYRRARSAYDDYLRKMAILADAKRQWIASIDPKPIKGKMNDKLLMSLAILRFNQIMNISGAKVRTNFDESLQAATMPIIRQAEKTAQKRLAQMKNQELTDAQIQSVLDQAIKESTQRAIRQAEKAQTLTRTQTRTATRQAVRTGEATRTATRSAESTQTATKALTTELTSKLPKFKLPGKGASDKEKRDYLKQTKNAYAIRMGQLGKDKKDVWWTYIPGNPTPVVVVGRPPKGVNIFARGEGSGYRTAQPIAGRGLERPETRDIGFSRLNFFPDMDDGLGVSFHPKVKLPHSGKMFPLTHKFKKLPR